MAKTYSCVLVGVDVHEIEIETVLGGGFSGLTILGLPNDISRDMRERVRAALESIGVAIPARRVVVNIGPRESIRLARSPLPHLDFAVCACVLKALFEKEKSSITLGSAHTAIKSFFGGEVSLSGCIKPLSDSLMFQSIASRFPDCEIFLASGHNQVLFFIYTDLRDWFEQHIQNTKKKTSVSLAVDHTSTDTIDTPSVCAFLKKERQQKVLQTLQILLKTTKACVTACVAAAGRYHVLIAGEPGIGKSFTLSRLDSLLPPLSPEQKSEIQLIHGSEVGAWPIIRSPHHSCTSAALIGGSSLRPGEVTLAHHGVLFLDELAEFSRQSLEALREPLDNKIVYLARAGGYIHYPAAFQLCATTNPCPCGYLFSKKKPCRCLPQESRKYLQKISGPLLDRFCLQVWLSPVSQTTDCEKQDIFSKWFLKNTQLNHFVEHFLQIQEVSMQKNSLVPESSAKSYPDLKLMPGVSSLRSQMQLSQLEGTFSLLFPELKDHPRFSSDVARYRCLGSLLSHVTSNDLWDSHAMEEWLT